MWCYLVPACRRAVSPLGLNERQHPRDHVHILLPGGPRRQCAQIPLVETLPHQDADCELRMKMCCTKGIRNSSSVLES